MFSVENTERNFSAKEIIDANILNMIEDPVLKNANWGFVIYDPKTKKVINAHNENERFIPASTTKLLTTDAAMGILGSKFKWSTQLEYSGEITEEGVLEGNLYIIGSGDPSIGTGKAGSMRYSEISEEFKQAIIEKGIKKINGDIILQTAVFKDNKKETLPAGIIWIDTPQYYLPAGNSSIADPQKEKVVSRNRNLSSSTGKKYFYISPYTGKFVFTDQLPTPPVVENNDEENSEEENTPPTPTLNSKLPDAPHYLAKFLKASLTKKGITSGKIYNKIIDLEPEKRKVLSTYHSPTLNEMVYYINQRSDNHLSEALLRSLGFQKHGNQTIEAGRYTVNEYLKSENFDMENLTYFDGSGLSRNNSVSPMAQVKFLSRVSKEAYFKDFFDSLPIAGHTGTLKGSFKNTLTNGKIFAKTGTLNKVKTLAGYIKTDSGRTLAFSLMINNYNGSVHQVKKKMEEILDTTIEL